MVKPHICKFGRSWVRVDAGLQFVSWSVKPNPTIWVESNELESAKIITTLCRMGRLPGCRGQPRLRANGRAIEKARERVRNAVTVTELNGQMPYVQIAFADLIKGFNGARQ